MVVENVATIRTQLTVYTFLLLLVLPFVAADLEISGVRVYVDGSREPDANDRGGDIDNYVYPDSNIKIKLTLRNDFSRSDDIDIDDIDVEAVLEDVDLGADIRADIEPFSLAAGKSKEVTLEFRVPMEVKTGTYPLIITIDGEADDDDDTEYSEEIEFNVKVIKKDHDVRIIGVSVSDETPMCADTVTLAVELQNFGYMKENVRLTVTNEELGANFASITTLSEDIESPANKYTREYPIKIPSNASGYYDIKTYAAYAARYDDEEHLAFTVSCDESVVVPVEDASSEDTTSQEVVTPVETVKEVPVETSGGTVLLTTPATDVTGTIQTPSWFDAYKWPIIIVAVNILVVIIGVGVLYHLYRRRPVASAVMQTPAQPLGNLDFSKLDRKLDNLSETHARMERTQHEQQPPRPPQTPDNKFSYY